MNYQTGVMSVIILAYTRLKDTKRCINSIINRTYMTPYELVLVYMAGNDAILDYFYQVKDLQKQLSKTLGNDNLFKNIIIINNDKNLGLQPGRNQGMSVATGEFMMWLDNDTWIEDNHALLPVRPGGWVRNRDCLGRFAYWLGTHKKRTGEYWLLGQTGGYWGPNKITWRRRCIGIMVEVDGLMGYNIAFNREVYDIAGPIDDFYGVRGRQDTEFCFNAKYHGFKCQRMGYLGVAHKAGGVLGREYASKFHENTAYMIRKWNHPERLKKLNLIPQKEWIHD